MGLTACNLNAAKPEETVGLYRADGAKLDELGVDYFVVTADLSLFLLRSNQADVRREYAGDIDGSWSVTLKNGEFRSGDYIGTRVEETPEKLNEPLRRLASLNEGMVELIAGLNQAGVSAELRLDRREVSFSELQDDFVRLVAGSESRTAAVAGFVKDQGAKKFFVTDFNNQQLYKQDDVVALPAGAEGDAAALLASLEDGTAELEVLD